MKSESFVSVVIVVQSDVEEIHPTLLGVYRVLDEHYTDFEMVIIAAGLHSTNAQAEDAILKNIPGVRIIHLSAEVSIDVALAAGLENAIGDFVVLWNPCSDPLDAIPGMVSQCRVGQDVVIGVTTRAKSLSYRFIRTVANKTLHAIGYDLPKNSTCMRCLSRRAVNAVTRVGRFHHQFFLRIQKTGYPVGIYTYVPLREAEGLGLLTSIRRLLRLMVFNSSRPLRWMSGIGFCGSLAAFIFASYSVLIHLLNGHVVEGWTSLVFFMSLLFNLQFIMMAFFGEYLGRLLDESSAQSEYAVVYERHSDVMLNTDRVNVLSEAVSPENNRVQTGRNN
ncbi:glycosyltransferase family protein [Erwinia psidii]|uniref:Glycosyl transferase family 2 n=1 Tax=Erwinia psidii TaxID=69224 RepID=A0A3N6SPL3_9GAMM|nr:glycosyl transferase family 2 [Erwinia psidii]MCX8956422.1 glycosyl transferase family 2 [Erwinia psidii]MCX8962268.1 glycosyl transferase family 2 [Erwinia psidii]MCX8965813.1 glycosyl transferase family 2 [Erwinia psidii]RQM39756.1 glycosyl transferase family 2 [Erwinia psidii]